MVTKEKALLILISYAEGLLKASRERSNIDRLGPNLAQVQKVLGAAATLADYIAQNGTDQGWDGQFRGAYPDLVPVVWAS